MLSIDKIKRKEVAAIVKEDEAEKMLSTLSEYFKKRYTVYYDILENDEKKEKPYYKFLLVRIRKV